MNRRRGVLYFTLVAASAIVVAPALIAGSPDARGLAQAASTAPLPDAPSVPTLVAMRDGFKWGITHVDVITTFNKLGGVIDQDYDPLLRRAQPGPQQEAIEADRDNQKAAIERSYIRFDFPTGYDQTGLKGEYSYKNNEAVIRVERQGKKRYFFFMGAEPGERLWKIYDEVPLNDQGPMGKTFAEAVGRVQGILGVAGRPRAADPEHSLDFPTVDWQDGATHLRLVDRSRAEHLVGVVLEERATMNALPQLRAHKEEDPFAMDPSISAATRSGVSDPSKAAAAPAGSAKPPAKKK